MPQSWNHFRSDQYSVREREIAHILRDSDPRAAISDEALPTEVPVWTPADLQAKTRNYPDTRPTVHLDGDAPAGIILHVRHHGKVERRRAEP